MYRSRVRWFTILVRALAILPLFWLANPAFADCLAAVGAESSAHRLSFRCRPGPAKLADQVFDPFVSQEVAEAGDRPRHRRVSSCGADTPVRCL